MPAVYSGTPAGLLTYTSPSVKRRRNAAGQIVHASHNLMLHSEAFDNAVWSKNDATVSANATTAPDTTSNADTLVEATTTAIHYMTQTFTVVAGRAYAASVYAKQGTGTRYLQLLLDANGATDGVYATFDVTAGTVVGASAAYGAGVVAANALIENAGSGWFRCTIYGILGTTGTTARFAVVLANSTGFVPSYLGAGQSLHLFGAHAFHWPADHVYHGTGASQVFALAYEFSTAGVNEGIFPEPAITNSLLRSQEFDNASWTKSNTTISANAATAPDGTTTADKIIESAVNSTHFVEQIPTLANNTQYVVSVYVKAVERTQVYVWLADTGWLTTNAGAIFNLSGAGSVVSSAGTIAPTIQAEANGWYRLTMGDTTAAAGTRRVRVVTINAGAGTYLGDGTSGLLAWGIQIEAQTRATSYVQTLGATVTRAADAITLPVADFPYLATEGTLYVEWRLDRVTTSIQVPVSLDDNTFNNRMSPYADIDNSVAFFVASGGATQAAIDIATSPPAGTVRKQAVAWAANDFVSYYNGTAGTPDTAGSIPTVTRMSFGFQVNTSYAGVGGYIRAVRYYPRRLANWELQELTQ